MQWVRKCKKSLVHATNIEISKSLCNGLLKILHLPKSSTEEQKGVEDWKKRKVTATNHCQSKAVLICNKLYCYFWHINLYAIAVPIATNIAT